jgi:hypothetical protein
MKNSKSSSKSKKFILVSECASLGTILDMESGGEWERRDFMIDVWIREILHKIYFILY